MQTASSLAKRIAFLAAMLDANRLTERQLYVFLRGYAREDLPKHEADSWIAIRHFGRILDRAFPDTTRQKRSYLTGTLRVKTADGRLTNADFDSLFEDRLPSNGPYGGAGTFATTLAYLACLISENRATPEQVEELYSTSHTYRSRDEDPDVSVALMHIRNTLAYNWRWSTNQCHRAVRDISTKIRTGDLTSNTLDDFITRRLP